MPDKNALNLGVQRFGQARNRVRRHQINDQRQRYGSLEIHADNTNAAHLEQTGEVLRRHHIKARLGFNKIDTVIGDQHRAPIDQPERQIGLAGAGRPPDQNPGPVEGDGTGVKLTGVRVHEPGIVPVEA